MPASIAVPTASRSCTSPRSKESAGGSGRPEEVQRRARRAAVHDDRDGRSRAISVGELLLDDVGLDRRQLAEAAHGRQAALEDRGHRRLVELHDERGARAAGRRRRRRGRRPPRRATAPGRGGRRRPPTARSPRRALEPGGQRPRPGGLHLERAGVAAATSWRASRSRCRNSRARRWSMPGRGTSRHPAGVRSTARSTSSAALRPIRSAPGTPAGQLGQVRRTPAAHRATSRTASAGSVPGRDPTPEAGPHGTRHRPRRRDSRGGRPADGSRGRGRLSGGRPRGPRPASPPRVCQSSLLDRVPSAGQAAELPFERPPAEHHSRAHQHDARRRARGHATRLSTCLCGGDVHGGAASVGSPAAGWLLARPPSRPRSTRSAGPGPPW